MARVVVTLATLFLVAADGHVNTYWPDTAGEWNYKIGYTTIAGKSCTSGMDSPLEIAYKSDLMASGEPVNIHQCSYKCADAKTLTGKGCAKADLGAKVVGGRDGKEYTVPCFCKNGYDADIDTTDEFSVCGDFALCQQVCDGSPECYGFHFYEGMNRCYLLKSGCQDEVLRGKLVDATGINYVAKMDPESSGGEDSCPMGVAVIAKGLENEPPTCAAVNDQYNPVEGDNFKYSTGCAHVEWSTADGCGWMVTVPAPEKDDEVADTPDCDSLLCLNAVSEANWIFGFGDDEYDENICSRTEPWLATGYCENKLWRVLCTEECNVPCDECSAWTSDIEDAATLVTEMLGLAITEGATACGTLKDYSMCNDPVVALVCSTTCPNEEGGRRLSAEQKQHLDSARHVYGTRFKHSWMRLSRT
jgi:hypothetical protein